ncbi:hypothetical protein [Anaeromicropila populeti]|uniref:hypothetical protein n=1 Tax=Anaeromicropila populeti TaxID=37658 RepID=UPI0015A5BB71|nr:hypothetical protein [Anaeromicropila populeti]
MSSFDCYYVQLKKSAVGLQQYSHLGVLTNRHNSEIRKYDFVPFVETGLDGYFRRLGLL